MTDIDLLDRLAAILRGIRLDDKPRAAKALEICQKLLFISDVDYSIDLDIVAHKLKHVPNETKFMIAMFLMGATSHG